ncbi:MAG TPA: response regulator [Elainellaceae cyanobacterium]
MYKILVIEDEVPVRDDLLELLEIQQFRVVGAENGVVGVQTAYNWEPDLIICDVMMPGLDGYGVLERLRSDPRTSLIPFIFLTAKGTVNDFRKGLKLGADDYLTKPYEQTDLLEAIATRLSKHTMIRQQQQQVIQQLQHKLANLQKDSALKDDFLSTASHELRSPITNIMMAIPVLQGITTDERQQRYIEILQQECARELDLINDLLDLQRLEAGASISSLETIDLQHWIPTLLEPFEFRIQSRQQQFQFKISDAVSDIVIDSSDLQRILTELLSNASKYTRPGGQISLIIQPARATRPDTLLSPPCILMTVQNEAEIPHETIPLLFDRFYRIPGGDRWQQGGTGLGLTLAKKLITRLNGDIWVSSASGWTSFTIQLPCATPDTALRA